MPLNRLHSAGYMTNWAARMFAAAIDRKLKPHGISSAHLPVLFALGDGGTLSLKALTIAAAVEHPTMVATLGRMERAGLIQRTVDPKDRRSSLISLTEAAKGKIGAVRKATEEVNAIALSQLGEAERELFLAMQEKIVMALEQDASRRKHRRISE